MKPILLIAQIIVSLVVVILILLQQRGSGLGSAFGGDGGFYATRRGIQKKLFGITIFFIALFVICGVANLLL